MRHRRLSGVAGLALLAALASGGAAMAASPAEPSLPTAAWAYAVVRDATSPVSTPGPKDHGSSNGGAATVLRLGTGRSQVTFSGVGVSGGVVIVDALNTKHRICRVDTWYVASFDEVVQVSCFRRSGQRQDTPFVVHWLAMSGTSSPAVAYLWANDATTTDYTPSPAYNFNMAGGTTSVHRVGTGLYRIRFEDMGFVGGQAHVSPYGANRTACSAVKWGIVDDPAGPDEESVTVRCRDFSGNAKDSQFTLAFWNNQGPKGLDGPRAYARATRPKAASYAPSAANQYSSPGVQWRFVRTRTGVYTVRITDAEIGGMALVTTTGDKPVNCQLASIARSGTLQKVGVRCFEFDGSPADAPFVITHTR